MNAQDIGIVCVFLHLDYFFQYLTVYVSSLIQYQYLIGSK